ncbi:MAG: EF-hand domain-containing protein [Nitrospirae bacterium]|nr:EF-hand domain-containing protein [Nitrospirota bacterium]
MKHAVTKFAVSVSLVISLAGTGGAAHDFFRQMDADSNESVSHEEFERDMGKDAFDRLDRNKDGILSPDEWDTVDYFAEHEGTQEVFRYIDRDADKRISFPEFTDYIHKYSNIEEAFMITDKNRDGRLSPDEVTARPLFRLIKIRF